MPRRPEPSNVTPITPSDERGKVERAVAEQLHALGEHGKPGLAASALMLAQALDNGAGLATAAVARELRATLTDIARTEADDSDGAIRELLAAMSAPLLD